MLWLWDNEYDDGFVIDREEGDVRNFKGYFDVLWILRKFLVSFWFRSVCFVDRGLKRCDIFLRFVGEIGVLCMEGKDFKRSKSDLLIIVEKKWRKNIVKFFKRLLFLWMVSKRGENYLFIFCKRKVSW